MSELYSTYDALRHNVSGVSFIRLLTRAFGVCFFSLLSLGLAFYAFIALPQVQDLFFDVRSQDLQGAIYWIGFYIVGTFIWAFPLIFTARLLLLQNFDVIGVDTEARFNFFVFRLPSFFVVFAFLAVLIGVLIAASNLPEPTLNDDVRNKVEVPIQDALITHLRYLLFATGVMLVLVLIRNTLFSGLGRLVENLEKGRPEDYKKTLIRFERWARKPAANLDQMDIHLTQLKPAWLSLESWIAAQRSKVFMVRYLARLMMLLLILVVIHFLSYSSFVQTVLGSVTFSSIPLLGGVFQFISDTLWLKRAAFMFVMFGAWLPFISLLALFSNRFQFPFIVTLIVTLTVLTVIVSDGHDARVLKLPAKEIQSELKPVSFKQAVDNWKQANGWAAKGCDVFPEGAAELNTCPRPIIVAGEGGGSRAAFLLATVLGELEDASLTQINGSQDRPPNPSAKPFHRQLFAVSSVSGSSVGAAFYMGALQRREMLVRPENLDQFKQAVYRQKLWFLNIGKARQRDEKGNLVNRPDHLTTVTYKDSLQAALSNDFLSPVMIAYLARDVLTLSRTPTVMDRAGVLETSWEYAFDSVYGLNDQKLSVLGAPIQSFTASNGSWMPLLFLNSTSTETGRRVIASPVKVAENLPDNKPLFVNAYDVHEMFCSQKPDDEVGVFDKIARFFAKGFSPVTGAKRTCIDKKPTTIDIRLSTAAGLSARSPFVSPHGGIRDSTAQAVDSLVDGGYFDNSGAVTALEIATALKSVDGRLQPFMIQVSSEPDWFKDSDVCVQGSAPAILQRPEVPDESDFKPLGTLGNIFTVNTTRTARGYETILQSPGQIARLNNGVFSHGSISVCPQPKRSFLWDPRGGSNVNVAEKAQRGYQEDQIKKKAQKQAEAGWKSVSLSWWLSPPLQAYLDAQVYQPRNIQTQECVISLLRDRAADDLPNLTKQCSPISKAGRSLRY